MAKKIIKIFLLVAIFLGINHTLIANFSYKVIANIKINSLDNFNQKLGEDYLGILEIPKINLKKGFYNINSQYNRVKYGLQLIKYDPNLVILASHSGNSLISYFKDLDHLTVGDEIRITYKDAEDIYTIKYFYQTTKNGVVENMQDQISSKIILTTCDKEDLKKQLVYVGEKSN